MINQGLTETYRVGTSHLLEAQIQSIFSGIAAGLAGR
jgi:hypothetical protein